MTQKQLQKTGERKFLNEFVLRLNEKYPRPNS
jgi:hypothetical protein